MFNPLRMRDLARGRYAMAVGAVYILLLSQSAPAQDLTLSDVLSRAAGTGPIPAVNMANIEVAKAGIVQAQVRPQPTIGVDVEDFVGTGPYSPVDRSQTTAWYEQSWERGGKREARLSAARAEMAVSVERGRLRMLDLLAQVQAAWVEALAAETAIPIAERRLATAARLEAEVKRRVARALDPLFAAERARGAVAQARISLDQSRETARNARANLATWWGGNADYQLDSGSFGTVTTSQGVSDQMVDLALLSAERDAAEARRRLAKTADFGDPRLRAGVRHFGDGNDVALMVGGAIPLGNRSANRGNVQRADAQHRAADAELAVVQAETERDVRRLVADNAAIASEIERIDREVTPSVVRAANLALDGFRRGGTAFTFLEITEAEKATLDVQIRRLDLLKRLHLNSARLDRLTGRHASLITIAENR